MPRQNGENINYEVSIDESKLGKGERILTNDVKGVIRPALNELKVSVIRRTQGFRQARCSFLRFFVCVFACACLSPMLLGCRGAAVKAAVRYCRRFISDAHSL